MTAPPSFGARDVARTVNGASSFEAGQRYQREGRARLTAITPDGCRITGEVRGSAPVPYRQDVSIYAYAGRAAFDSRCTCPVRTQCKHVAALLLQHLAEELIAPRPHLTAELAHWLDEFEKAARRGVYHDSVAGTSPRQQIVYLVELVSGSTGPPMPLITPVSVRLDRDSRASTDYKPYDATNVVGRAPAKYVTDADVAILARLAAIAPTYTRSGYDLSAAVVSELFDRVLATGRARWRQPDGTLLVASGARQGAIVWRIGGEGAQTAALEIASPDTTGAIIVLPLAPPRWLDPSTGEVGLIETGLAAVVAGGLLRAPAVPVYALEPTLQRLSRLGLTGTQLPRIIGGAEPLAVTPTPIAVVTLTKVVRPSTRRWSYEDAIDELPVIRLLFDYAGKRIGATSGEGPFTMMVDDRLVRVARVQRTEAAFAKRLAKAGLERLAGRPGLKLTPDQPLDFTIGSGRNDEIANFLLDTRPALEAEGWRIEVDAGFPLKLAVADDVPWKLEIASSNASSPLGNAAQAADSSGVDWFDAALGVEVEGYRVDVLPAVVAMLRQLPPDFDPAAFDDAAFGGSAAARHLTLPLNDGRTLAVPYAKLRPILSALWGLFARDEIPDGPLRIAEWRAGELAAVGAEAGLGVIAPERVVRLARELGIAASAEPTSLPPSFGATLRPYQQAGLECMQRLARAGFGLVLADDMGLGKTVQTLAHLAVEHAAGRLDTPALVIAPTSVVPNWLSEAAAFAPALRVLAWSGPDRMTAKEKLAGADLVVTSYPLLARDTEVLGAQRWSVVVIDEAQFVRNPVTAAAQALFGLTRRQTLALTGTPVENSLGDVWSLAHATNPGLLGSAKDFVSRYKTPIEKRGDPYAKRLLARRLRPFLLRRTKDEVAPELPAKTEIAERVTLEGAQAALYEGVRLAMQARVQEAIAGKGLARSRIVVLDALLKLRQACCDPRLVKIAAREKTSAARLTTATASAKLARLLELLATFRGEGRAVLLFSQFTSMLALIRAELDAQNRDYAWLTGDTVDRTTPVRRFQSGEVDLFLVSLKAGGTGLTLTAADAVILYDPWWNPAVEAQAIDRAHRIGQAKPVFVHRLIAVGTIEEKMLALQARKRDLAAALWDADDPESRALDQLTADDVIGLFA